MLERLKRHWISIALFFLIPISSCTLISEVDRGLIDDGTPDAAGATGGRGGSAGSSGTNGTGGSSGTDDAPTSNDSASDDTDDAAGD